MLFNTAAAVLALATGFAAAKPVFSPSLSELPAYHRRSAPISPAANKRQSSNNPFNFIDGFNNFNNQQQVLDVKQETLQIVDNGRQQAVVQQVQEVLVVNQQQNGFNNDLNNLFRKSNARRNNNDQSTVMLVVQEIQVAVDDGQGNLFQQNVFAQSAVVANRGRRATQTVMIFAAETLIAQNILGNGNGNGNGNNNNNNGLGNGIGQLSNGTGVAAALPTQTAGVQLFGDKPTWSSVAADPAATLGGIWQAELQDAQDAANNNNDNQANADAAQAVKQALDAAKAGQ